MRTLGSVILWRIKYWQQGDVLQVWVYFESVWWQRVCLLCACWWWSIDWFEWSKFWVSKSGANLHWWNFAIRLDFYFRKFRGYNYWFSADLRLNFWFCTLLKCERNGSIDRIKYENIRLGFLSVGNSTLVFTYSLVVQLPFIRIQFLRLQHTQYRLHPRTLFRWMAVHYECFRAIPYGQ